MSHPPSSGVRKGSKKEQRAILEALNTARARPGFAAIHDSVEAVLALAEPWLLVNSVRAKMMEVAPPGARYGFAFVPAKLPYFPKGGYKVAPLTVEGRPVVTLFLTLPAASIEAALREPDPLTALLEIEIERLRKVHAALGLPEPKALASFFEGGPDTDYDRPLEP